jgi:hypothetical protein
VVVAFWEDEELVALVAFEVEFPETVALVALDEVTLVATAGSVMVTLKVTLTCLVTL